MAGKGESDSVLPHCVYVCESLVSSLYSRPNNIVSFSVLCVGPSMPFRIEIQVFTLDMRPWEGKGQWVWGHLTFMPLTPMVVCKGVHYT